MPDKQIDTRGRNAYIVGGGLSGLSAAFFLLQDCGFPGSQITILEKERLSGGACDGYSFEDAGYIMRGDHRLEKCSPVLTRIMDALPSAEMPGKSVYEAFRSLDREDPNYSLCRITEKRGEIALSDGRFGLSDAGCMEVWKLLLAADEDLAEKRISDVLSPEVLESPFWLYMKTDFFFRESYSALEFKILLKGRLKDLGGLADHSAYAYTKYNLYESLILPLTEELEKNGVEFRYGVSVTDIAFDCARGRKRATRIDYVEAEEEGCIDLKEGDVVLITLGSCVENSTRGSLLEAAPFFTEIREGGSFDLWRRIALQNPSFGHPEVFCLRPQETAVMSATITTGNRKLISYIKKYCKRDPFSGGTVTGGIVTVKDSPWLLNWSVARQPLFRNQEEDKCIIHLTGLCPEQNGEYTDKPMSVSTGEEICAEWLYHLGVPSDQIPELSENGTQTIPVSMPFAASPLLPRQPGDRPDPVPEGARNFAFIGQFTESEGEAARSAEYAARTAMEAVCSLFGLEEKLPAASASSYDLRVMFRAAAVLRDGRSIRDMDLKRSRKTVLKNALKLVRGTEIEQMLKEEKLL